MSILSEHHEAASPQLSSRSGDRFAGPAIDTTESGAVLLPEPCA